MTPATTSPVTDLDAQLARPALDALFDDAELTGLPEPVRRYLRAAVAPGTPISRAVRVTMRGQLRLGRRWLPFRARETLAPHEGFVWEARVAGVIAGADHYAAGEGALDWKLLGLVRVAHGEGADVTLSAAGRCAAEAVWVPTTLLPRFGVRWEADDDRHIAATYRVGDVEVTGRFEIDSAGGLLSATFERWGDPNGDGTFGLHPFGLVATGRTTFAGLSVPATGRVGWYPGTERWADGEFFRYQLLDVAPVPAERRDP